MKLKNPLKRPVSLMMGLFFTYTGASILAWGQSSGWKAIPLGIIGVLLGLVLLYRAFFTDKDTDLDDLI